jgi:hypothetical protein
MAKDGQTQGGKMKKFCIRNSSGFMGLMAVTAMTGVMTGMMIATLSGTCAYAVEESPQADVNQSVNGTVGQDTEKASPFSLFYTNIFYGPSLSSPGSYQPDSQGNPNLNNPIYTKNFLSASYGFTENMAVTGTMYFLYRPVLGQQLTMMDPSIRVSHAAIAHTDWGFNIYSDVRWNFGVTDASRQADMIGGAENFNYVSWEIANSRFTTALRIKERYNFYGKRGAGTDVELYLAPEVRYQLTPTVALTGLYEMQASHQFGDSVSYFTNDGTDFEPGVSWDIVPSLTVNPYLNIQTGGKVSAASTSVGMFLNWAIL